MSVDKLLKNNLENWFGDFFLDSSDTALAEYDGVMDVFSNSLYIRLLEAMLAYGEYGAQVSDWVCFYRF